MKNLILFTSLFVTTSSFAVDLCTSAGLKKSIDDTVMDLKRVQRDLKTSNSILEMRRAILEERISTEEYADILHYGSSALLGGIYFRALGPRMVAKASAAFVEATGMTQATAAAVAEAEMVVSLASNQSMALVVQEMTAITLAEKLAISETAALGLIKWGAPTSSILGAESIIGSVQIGAALEGVSVAGGLAVAFLLPETGRNMVQGRMLEIEGKESSKLQWIFRDEVDSIVSIYNDNKLTFVDIEAQLKIIDGGRVAFSKARRKIGEAFNQSMKRLEKKSTWENLITLGGADKAQIKLLLVESALQAELDALEYSQLNKSLEKVLRGCAFRAK
jgi:hypothetical protein